jgi:hypothetical protein
MKRSSRKLVLQRSTIRLLDLATVQRVDGGTIAIAEPMTLTVSCPVVSVPTFASCSRSQL